VRTDKDGVTMEDALRRCGSNGSFPEAEKERANATAYIELHIEQGPVLEKTWFAFGVVLGTRESSAMRLRFMGRKHTPALRP